MIVCRDFETQSYNKESVVTVGTFDGVHLGHKRILETLNRTGIENNLRKVVVTFDPHPRIVLNNYGEVKMLSTIEEKLEEFEHSGVDVVNIIKFDKNFATTSAIRFYNDILIGKIGLSFLIVGYDHMFGKNREGSIVTIKSLSEQNNFRFIKVDAFELDGKTISSSLIRKALKENDVEKAARYLGKNYELSGEVIYGDKRGRAIGFPTANLVPSYEHKLIPGNGVYKVKVFIDNEVFTGMMNIGTRPTIEENKANNLFFEIHILDFDRDIYGRTIKVEFEKFIREEKKFNSIDELVNQLNKDKEKIIHNN